MPMSMTRSMAGITAFIKSCTGVPFFVGMSGHSTAYPRVLNTCRLYDEVPIIPKRFKLAAAATELLA